MKATRVGVAAAIKTLTRIERGEKSPLDTMPWLKEQLDLMFEHGFLPESPGDYTPSPFPGDTSILPITHADYSRREDIDRILREERTGPFHILGISSGTFNKKRIRRLPEVIVLGGGSITALRQFLTCLLWNMEAADSSKEKKCLVIDNHHGFWNPLLKAYGLKNKDDLFKKQRMKKDPLFKSHGVVIAPRTKDAARMIRQVVTKEYRALPQETPRPGRFRYGAHLPFATSNGKKKLETGEILDLLEANADLHNLNELIDYYQSADEVRETYAGNASEKMDYVIARIIAMGDVALHRQNQRLPPRGTLKYKRLCWRAAYMLIRERASKRGLDPNKIAFLTNDTGLDVKVIANGKPVSIDLSQEPEFKAAHKYVRKGKPWPGVELNHVLDALGGAEGLVKQLTAFKKRYESANKKVTLRFQAVSRSTFLTLPLIDVFGTPPITAHASTVEDLSLRPSPYAPSYTTDHFLIPSLDNPSQRTRAEMGSAFFPVSPDALAIKTLLGLMGVPKLTSHQHFNIYKPAIHARSHAPSVFSYESIKKIDGSDTASIISLLQKSDAFLFPLNDTVGPLTDDNFARHGLAFSTIGVDRQTMEDHVTGKFFAAPDITNPRHPYWPLWQIVIGLQKRHLIKQPVKELIDCIGSSDAAASLLQKNLAKGSRPNALFPFEPEEWGKIAPDHYPTVAIAGSASTKQPNILDGTNHFTLTLASRYKEQGITFVTGGGKHGVMGQVYDSINVLRDIARHTSEPCHVHFRGIQCPRTINLEGVPLISGEKWDPRDQLLVERDRHRRMSKIVNAPTLIDRGGLGTIEEICKLLILKSEDRRVKSYPMAINNIDGCYDGVKACLTAAYCEANNIHIIDTDRVEARHRRDFNGMTELERNLWAANQAANIMSTYFNSLPRRPQLRPAEQRPRLAA